MSLVLGKELLLSIVRLLKKRLLAVVECEMITLGQVYPQCYLALQDRRIQWEGSH